MLPSRLAQASTEGREAGNSAGSAIPRSRAGSPVPGGRAGVPKPECDQRRNSDPRAWRTGRAEAPKAESGDREIAPGTELQGRGGGESVVGMSLGSRVAGGGGILELQQAEVWTRQQRMGRGSSALGPGGYADADLEAALRDPASLSYRVFGLYLWFPPEHCDF